MINGIDISNLQGHPDTWPVQGWYPIYQACSFVIVQGIEPPAGYPGHDFIDPETGKRGYTGVALRQAKRDGKKVGVYVWLWNGLADTYHDIQARLDTVPSSLSLDMRPWVDVEDTGAHTPVSRQTDLLVARNAADDWASGHGLPPSGGYSGDWYVNGYLDGYWPGDWLKWWANYSAPLGSIVDGTTVAHQYTSTSVDQSVMLESEIVGGTTPTPEPAPFDQAWLDKKAMVVNTLGYIKGDLVAQLRAEANRRNGPRKTIINQLAAELERVTSDALG